MTNSKLIDLQGITKTFPLGGFFGRQRLTALEDIDLSLQKGEILAILGESGSGKSTLARILALLETPDRGAFLLGDQNLIGTSRNRRARLAYGARVQMIFQDPFASLNSVHTVGYHLKRPLQLHRPQLSRAEIQRETIALMESVGLRPGAAYLEKFPFELSGGQRQRVAIARALAVEPEILIADEPTSMLDVSIRMDILNLIKGLRDQRGLSIILITHDLPSAWYLSDRVAVIYGGQLVETGPTAEVLAKPAHPYTQLLLEVAEQKIMRQRQRAEPLTAETPRSSCLFAGRCPRAASICRQKKPSLDKLSVTRAARCFFPFVKPSKERETYDA